MIRCKGWERRERRLLPRPTNRKSRRMKPFGRGIHVLPWTCWVGGAGGYPGDMSQESLNRSLRFGMSFNLQLVSIMGIIEISWEHVNSERAFEWGPDPGEHQHWKMNQEKELTKEPGELWWEGQEGIPAKEVLRKSSSLLHLSNACFLLFLLQDFLTLSRIFLSYSLPSSCRQDHQKRVVLSRSHGISPVCLALVHLWCFREAETWTSWTGC